MPIRIDNSSGEDLPTVAILAGEEWIMVNQLYVLDRWLKEEGKNLEPGAYVADIGIDEINPEGRGGGGVLSVEAIRIMAKIGMELWVSEYGGREGLVNGEEGEDESEEP